MVWPPASSHPRMNEPSECWYTEKVKVIKILSFHSKASIEALKPTDKDSKNITWSFGEMCVGCEVSSMCMWFLHYWIHLFLTDRKKKMQERLTIKISPQQDHELLLLFLYLWMSKRNFKWFQHWMKCNPPSQGHAQSSVLGKSLWCQATGKNSQGQSAQER